MLWTSKIQLSDDYFQSLASHAVPLDDRAMAALAHNAMALDIYAWLAQRLHRVDYKKPQFIAWQRIKEQFGARYVEHRVPLMDVLPSPYYATMETLTMTDH